MKDDGCMDSVVVNLMDTRVVLPNLLSLLCCIIAVQVLMITFLML